MTDRDDSKTKNELIAEIEALRGQLDAKNAGSGEDASGDSTEPTFSRPITRREALQNWIAPVVLSVPLGAAMHSEIAQAQVPPTAAPPTSAPTAAPPTSAPTAAPPTSAPTAAPPTSAPTAAPPTSVPTQAPAPTRQSAAPVPGIGAAGAVALGGALAAAGAKALKNRKKASDKLDSEDDETS